MAYVVFPLGVRRIDLHTRCYWLQGPGQSDVIVTTEDVKHTCTLRNMVGWKTTISALKRSMF